MSVNASGSSLRHAVCSLRSPAFSLVAILALAIGIGANTAIFSVINTLLLQRLPYRDADRLVDRLGAQHRRGNRKSNVVGPANFIHWREMNQVVRGSRRDHVHLQRDRDRQRRARGAAGAVDLGRALPDPRRVSPRIGRGFTADENVPGSRVGRHQRSAVEAALRRRSGHPRPADRVAGHALHGRRRHAAGLLVSRQERRRLAADRLHGAVAHAARTIAHGRRPPEGRASALERAQRRHDAGVRAA